MGNIEALKKLFRSGQQREALQQCETLCRSEPQNIALKRLCALMHGTMGNFPASASMLRDIVKHHADDADALFNLGVCEREQHNLKEAESCYLQYTSKFPKHAEGWVNLAECQYQLNDLPAALQSVRSALKLDSSSIQAWISQGDVCRAMKQYDGALDSYRRAHQIQPNALASFNQGALLLELNRYVEAIECLNAALRLAPDMLPARSHRADAFHHLGHLENAVIDYRQVLLGNPADEAVLKKISICLVKMGQGEEAIQLFRNALKIQPSLLTAKLGITWVLGQMVPAWHLPMMNEFDRNNAYYLGLQAAVPSGKSVLEIGTGSGLLAMMAARLGARSVATCETVSLIAETARKIVEQNRLQDSVSVLSKASFDIDPGKDLPEKADLLVHEIFSSELIAEHVLPALEDAKRRLLKPDAKVLPGAASIMIALVGGDDLGKYLHADESFGFDLRLFNAISPRKIPLYRDDLNPKLLSDAIEAFRFDFQNASSFPSQGKTIQSVATGEGLCYGVIQWIRLEFGAGIVFENSPSQHKPVANWQRTVFRFEEPIRLEPGEIVLIEAAHDRVTPWFNRVAP